jgi:hypothetical protein
MNGMFSNNRGLGDLAKHLFFVDCIRDHNVDFLLFRIRVDEILHTVFLTPFQAALTLCGILVCLVAVLVAS